MGFIDSLLDIGSSLGSLFGWMPEGMSVIIVAAVSLLVLWFGIEIIIKIVGTFF